MIKTYILTTPARNNSFVLRGKTGNVQRFNFSGGDPLSGKSASIVLHSQYSQGLLEESEPFKQGFIKLAHIDNGGETPQEDPVNLVEEVKSPEQLIEFVATTLEKVYQRPEAALNYAKSKGYDFPNLELKKDEK